MKISYDEYEKNMARLQKSIWQDLQMPYIDIVTSALKNNIPLRENAITDEKALPKKSDYNQTSIERQLAHPKRSRKSKTPDTLKLSSLPPKMVEKLLDVIEEYRQEKRKIKDLFKTASRDERDEAKRIINSASLMFNAQNADFTDMQISALRQKQRAYNNAIKKINIILKPPFKGLDRHVLQDILENDDIPTTDMEDYLPPDLQGVQRHYAACLLKNAKREYAFFQNAFKELPEGTIEKLVALSENYGFKRLRPYLGKTGTLEYIKNSGTATDRQFEAIQALVQAFEADGFLDKTPLNQSHKGNISKKKHQKLKHNLSLIAGASFDASTEEFIDEEISPLYKQQQKMALGF